MNKTYFVSTLSVALFAFGCAGQPEDDSVGSAESTLLQAESPLPALSNIDLDQVEFIRQVKTGNYTTGLTFNYCTVRVDRNGTATATVNSYLHTLEDSTHTTTENTVETTLELAELIAELSTGTVTSMQSGGTDVDAAHVRVRNVPAAHPGDAVGRSLLLRAKGAYTARNSSNAAPVLYGLVAEACGY